MAEPQTVAGPCPKCGYVRTPQDRNPPWQCPRCHIAYAKFQAAAAAPIARLAAEGREMAVRARSDYSLAGLIAANVFALAVAFATRMTLAELMLVYWIQSVIIGLMNVYRMLHLNEYVADGMDDDDDGPLEDVLPPYHWRQAMLFALHYGAFHAGYLAFILMLGGGKLGAPGAYALCALGFFVCHAFSLRHNLESDARGRPHIGALFMLPYARVVPMHLTILFGVTGESMDYGPRAILLFGVLKTVADAVMHTVGHHIMRKSHGRTADG